jgi:hypothetical protein
MAAGFAIPVVAPFRKTAGVTGPCVPTAGGFGWPGRFDAQEEEEGPIAYVSSDNADADFAGSDWTWLWQADPFNGQGNSLLLTLEKGSDAETTTMPLGKFSVPSVSPVVTDISNAQLLLLIASNNIPSGSQTLSVYKCRRNFNASQATWNVYQTSSAWGSPGASNTTTDRFPIAIATATVVAGQTGWVEFTGSGLDQYVEDCRNGVDGFFAIIVERSSGADAPGLAFHSDEAADGLRPKLTWNEVLV